MLDFKDTKFLVKIRYIQKIEKKIYIYLSVSGALSRKFIWRGGGYVNLGTLILDNIPTLMKALQKQNS